MSVASEVRKPGRPAGPAAASRPAAAKRRKRGLEGGLADFGSHGEGNLARVLSQPLADYYLVLVSSALLVGLGVLMVLSASSVWSSPL